MLLMISGADLTAVWVSIKLAFVTTLVLMVICTPVAWYLAGVKSRLEVLPEAVFSLPLVLPPTVLGFFLLISLGPSGPLGSIYSFLGTNSLVFTFSGLVIGSVVYSFPFVFPPLLSAFEDVDGELLETAATLGAKPIDRFFSIVLPRTRSAFLTAAILGFAHTIGEFGVILMIGGSIPGETRTVSIAIYENVEKMDYASAFYLSLGLVIASFAALAAMYSFRRKRGGRRS